MTTERLHQGDLLDGNAKEGNRRWIAVILDEQEIETAIEEINEESGTDYTIADLDGREGKVCEKYCDLLLQGGGLQWDETLKEIVKNYLES